MTLMIRYGMPESLKNGTAGAQCVHVLLRILVWIFHARACCTGFFCKRSISLSGVCFREGGGVMSEPVRVNRMNKAGRRERKCPNM